jgi:Transmembrane secretion effector
MVVTMSDGTRRVGFPRLNFRPNNGPRSKFASLPRDRNRSECDSRSKYGDRRKDRDRGKDSGRRKDSGRGQWRSGRLGPLAGRNFRRFYVGYTTSLLGTAMSAVAIAFAVLDSGGTATSLGLVFAANIIPMIVFMLGGGVIADRLGRRPVMLTADVARCAAQSTLAVTLFLGRPHVWLFVAVAFVVGTGDAFFSPALSGLVVQLAPRDQLGNANALFGMAEPAASVAGPALAGILIAIGGPALPIAADAGSYAVSAVALALLSFPDAARPQARSLLRDLADGWAEFSSRAWLWLQTVQFTLFNLLTWGPYLVLGPVLARDYLGGARAWGAILACYGGGAIIGGLLALGRRPRRPLVFATVTTLGFPLPPLALALHLPLAAVAGSALLAGLGSALGGAIATTVTQQRLPASVLSRVGSFNMVGAYAFGPLAFIAAGPVAAVVGAGAVLGFGAAWAVFGTLAVLAAPSIRNLTWQETPPPPGELPHAAQHAARAALPERAHLGEPRRAQCAGVGRELRTLRPVVDVAPRALGRRLGQCGVRGDRLPPLLPVFGAAVVTVGVAPLRLALLEHPV